MKQLISDGHDTHNSGRTRKNMADKDMIWAYLAHLGYNMWGDPGSVRKDTEYTIAQDTMRFDKSLWDDLMVKLVDVGANMVVIDLGEGVKYDSHPELAVKGSWTTDELRAELAKMREMGLEPIPKLNFSACHDEWLGPYSRMLSTKPYYDACSDLIKEVCELFDSPRLFHLGMDEETWDHQHTLSYAVIRQYDLWWHDFLFLVEQVEKNGSQAWIWSDYIWHHQEEFLQRMPKSVMQSNWYYDRVFSRDVNYVEAYHVLEENGYDQIPTGSNWADPDNMRKTAEYCKDIIAPERLKGFMQTPWKPTVERRRARHFEAADEVGVSRAVFEG